MAPVLEPVATFHRSHSTPDLISISKSTPTLTLNGSKHVHSRKTLPSLPAFELPSFDHDPDFDASLALGTEESTIIASTGEERLSSITGETLGVNKPEKPVRRNTLMDRPRSWLPASRSATNIRDLLSERSRSDAGKQTNNEEQAVKVEAKTKTERSRTVSESFATFARRSWISASSRSPSPQRNPDSPSLTRDRAVSNGSKDSKESKSLRKRQISTLVESSEIGRPADSPSSTSRALNRASTYLTKIKQRPQSVLIKLGNTTESDDSCASSSTSLAPVTTITIDPLSTSQSTSYTESNTTMTEESFSDVSQLRDPLWSAFKVLEMEYLKFAPKSTQQRMFMVRSVLLVFLRNYGNHPSNTDLFPEDIERRTTVLNKWWAGLLDMLSGQGHQQLAGVDRPILLEAATMIMMRPEWRMATSYFMPLAERSPGERVRARSGTQSTAGTSLASSEAAAFLDESARHNVKNMFVGSLLAQMSLVVDKMSLRHAPLSLVNFCGKACAYAFFFVPGIAETLIRLWHLPEETIRRASDEFGLPRKNNGESEDIVALFPPILGSLGWNSVRAAVLRLRQHKAKLPAAAEKIAWMGPWVSRWRGRDTDLFFIFSKYYHILAQGFMPAGLPLIEKARAPAFVLVHAQLLTTLDTTIHRQFSTSMGGESGSGPHFFNSLYGADASATALPFGSGNLLKSMSENRLIILLKDFMAETSTDMTAARHTFAEAFMALMRAATRRVSQFDHDACFTLCDFLEEAIMVYDSFEDIERPDLEYIDWPFWFDVCKRILGSLNNMSEIRMLSFIFLIWDAVAVDPKRKEALCLDWLLEEETFDKFFNHWCPMVRAYFMRLVCWRVCRDAGSPNEVDS
jgi:hypothetical protein